MGTMQRRKRLTREQAGKARAKVVFRGVMAPKEITGREMRRISRAFAKSSRRVARALNRFGAAMTSLHEGNLDIDERPLTQDWAWAWRVMTTLPPEFEAAIFSDVDSLYEG